MRNRHHRHDRFRSDAAHAGEGHLHGGHPHRRRGGGGGRGGRLFDYGELRLLLLALLAQTPRHGYELIKAIEERLGGSYTPSPGVIYPTLSWLDDMGYARPDAPDGGRKRYQITAEGEAFLIANRAVADELLARSGAGVEGPGQIPPALIRAMENLKMALRLRLRTGMIDADQANEIAALLDDAARAIERG